MMKYPISLLGRINNNDPLIVENSSVICFAPAGFLLALWVLFKEKKKDPLLILLVGLDVFFAWYYCVGAPMWLSKITLLSFTNSNRGPQVLGFFQLTLFIRALSLKEKSPNRIVAALVALVSAAVPAFLAWGFTKYDTSGCVKEYFDVA